MKIILVVGIVGLLAGCDNAPTCSDSDTIATAVSIIKREYSLYNYNKIEIKNIRTTKKESDTGLSQCEADADLSYTNGLTYTKSITYTTQLTDDGKSVYVNIWGLDE